MVPLPAATASRISTATNGGGTSSADSPPVVPGLPNLSAPRRSLQVVIEEDALEGKQSAASSSSSVSTATTGLDTFTGHSNAAFALSPEEEASKPAEERRASDSKDESSTEDTNKPNASGFPFLFPVHQLEKLKELRELKSVGSVGEETEFFTNITTMHGPKRVYNGRTYSRLFWGLMMITSLVLLGLQIGMLVGNYFSHPILSEMSLVTADSGLELPSITVCNYNPIRKDYITYLNRTGDFPKDLLYYLIHASIQTANLLKTQTQEELAAADALYQKYMANHPDFNVSHFYMNAGFACSDIFKACAFDGQSFDCCSHAHSVLTKIGICHTLHVGNASDPWLNKQTAPGVDNGVILFLDANLDQQTGVDLNDDELVFNDVFENGFRYHLHSPDNIGYTSGESTTVSPGHRAYSAIAASRSQLLDKSKWGNCTKEWPFAEHPALPYSMSNCRLACQAKFFMRRCGCTPLEFAVVDKDPICTPLQLFTCLQEHHQTIQSAATIAALEPDCTLCSTECEYWQYISSTAYGAGFSIGATDWIRRHFGPRYTNEYVANNMATISVFYRDLTYQSFSQAQGDSFTQLLSNIGGNMGLFLGISTITIAEAIIFLVKVTWVFMSKKRRNHIVEKRKQAEEHDKRLEETIEKMANIELLKASILGGLTSAARRASASSRARTMTQASHRSDRMVAAAVAAAVSAAATAAPPPPPPPI